MSGSFRVRVFRGEQLLDERTFDGTLIKLGRHSSAHVPLDDKGAAFVHAVLTADGDALAINDVSGVRGTFVNGVRVSKKVLKDGDQIQIAGLRIVVDRPSLEAHAQAMPTAIVEAPIAPAPVALEPVAPAPEPVPAPRYFEVEPRPEPQPTVLERLSSPLDEQIHFAPKAFGTYVPRAPEPPRPAADLRRPALQLACYWGDTLLQLSQHAQPETVLMGPTERCALKAGHRERNLIEAHEGGFALSVDEGMKAYLRRGDEVTALHPGVHPIAPADFAWVEVAGLRVEASFTAQPPRAKAPLASLIDFRLVNLIVGLAFVAGAFVVAAKFQDNEDLVADDYDRDHSKLLVQFVQAAPPKVRTDALPAALENPEPAQATAAAAGREGMAGDSRKPIDKDRKVGAVGPLHIDTKELVKRQGLLAGFGGGSVAATFAGHGLGEVRAATGNLEGRTFGSNGGFDGLGLRGTGPGGGGDSLRSIGIGGVSTLGRSTGNSSYGQRDGLLRGPKDRSEVKIDDTPPETNGALDPELVRKVIRAHVSEIRFCYEQQLTSRPDLSGKVRVRFLVGGDGQVARVEIADGTTLDDSTVNKCIASRVRGWVFPAPKGGGSALVTYPFWLKPAGD